MRHVKIFIMISALLITSSMTGEAAEGDSYWVQMGQAWQRGFKNMIGAPLEIPMTLQRYHQSKDGRAGIRHMAGFTDGLFRTLNRAASGIWDIPVSIMPGIQEGLPPTPETLF